jgi:arylsulfatase A-like enzyme
MTPVLLLLLSCGGGRPPPIPAAEAHTYALAVDVPFAELAVPADSRDGRAPAADVPVLTDWELLQATQGAKTYDTRLPVRPRALFFFRPPEGMAVLDASGAEIPFGGPKRHAWSFDGTTLTLSVGADAPAPAAGDVVVRYPFATERERALNRAWSKAKDDADFVRTRVQVGPDTYGGLLLPAPAIAAFDLDVPPAAELTFRPGLVPPETLDDAPSDGAVFTAEVEADGATQVVWTRTIDDPAFDLVRVDLSAWAGKHVRLRLRTEPGATSRFDYAFFGEPAVASRAADPRRVILIFADTMRADHLGLYGYERDTTVPIDTWAQQAAVFDQARSVAPWTLPSSRGILTGKQPELWDQAETLQHRLRARGWATGMFAANVYLSSNFDMDRDWGRHHCTRDGHATDAIDEALAFLADNEGRDTLLLVQLMDTHLPYMEPSSYRTRYAASTPPFEIGEHFDRNALSRAQPRTPEERQWVIDRYDNNVAYEADEVGRLLATLRPDDIVVYFADHGEELWDHGGFEHGHTLYDELLHVPLVMRIPGVAASRIAEPVSLLDITPTVLDALGMPTAGLDGVSLLAAARGDATAKSALAARDQAFGRPLYGNERWGVLHAGRKYATTAGNETLYDLGADPAESDDVLDADADGAATWRGRLGAALGRDATLGYRVVNGRVAAGEKGDTIALLTVPGGIRAAWVGADATNHSAATVKVDGEVATIRWDGAYDGVREVFVVPVGDPLAVTPTLGLDVRNGDELVHGTATGQATGPLVRVRSPRPVTVTYGIAPVPGAGEATSGSDDEQSAWLQALGYQDDDTHKPKPEEKP